MTTIPIGPTRLNRLRDVDTNAGSGDLLRFDSGSGHWIKGPVYSTDISGGVATSISGTTDRITASPGTGAVVVDIAATYAGQASITTLGTIVTGAWAGSTIVGAYGGTGHATYANGDTLYASDTTTLTRLAGNATTTVKALLQSGNGSVPNAPAWTAIPTSIAGTSGNITASGSTGAITLDVGANVDLLNTAQTLTAAKTITTAAQGGQLIFDESATDSTNYGEFRWVNSRMLDESSSPIFAAGAYFATNVVKVRYNSSDQLVWSMGLRSPSESGGAYYSGINWETGYRVSTTPGAIKQVEWYLIFQRFGTSQFRHWNLTYNIANGRDCQIACLVDSQFIVRRNDSGGGSTQEDLLSVDAAANRNYMRLPLKLYAGASNAVNTNTPGNGTYTANFVGGGIQLGDDAQATVTFADGIGMKYTGASHFGSAIYDPATATFKWGRSDAGYALTIDTNQTELELDVQNLLATFYGNLQMRANKYIRGFNGSVYRDLATQQGTECYLGDLNDSNTYVWGNYVTLYNSLGQLQLRGDNGGVTISGAATFCGAASMRTSTIAFYNSGSVTTRIGGSIVSRYADAGNVTTGETDLYSDSIAGSTLLTDGDAIQAEYAGITVQHATATRQIKVYFGGTVVFDSTAVATNVANCAWNLSVNITRASSSTIRATVLMAISGITFTTVASYTQVGSLTLTSAQILKITGQAAATGAATNDIVAKRASVRFFPAP